MNSDLTISKARVEKPVSLRFVFSIFFLIGAHRYLPPLRRSSRKFRLFFMLFCLCLSPIGCNSHEIAAVPDELVGEWGTTATKFEGFTFEITTKALIFDDFNAQDGRTAYFISKIERLYEDQKILYRIHHRDEEGLTFIFAFYYETTDGGRIILKNQQKFV